MQLELRGWGNEAGEYQRETQFVLRDVALSVLMEIVHLAQNILLPRRVRVEGAWWSFYRYFAVLAGGGHRLQVSGVGTYCSSRTCS